MTTPTETTAPGVPGVTHRTFAIIPAAGQSERMGKNKLLLPVGPRTVIRTLLDALDGLVDRIFVLVREDDEQLRAELSQTAAVVFTADTPTADTRQSVERLLDDVRVMAHPEEADAWLLIPADHPGMSRETLMCLLRERIEQPEAIHIPTHEGRRGFPTLFPWSLAAEVAALPAGESPSELLNRPAISICEHAVDDPTILLDLDVPEDYERLVQSLA
jgi:molybdenum cofactor cytidylyltransferase